MGRGSCPTVRNSGAQGVPLSKKTAVGAFRDSADRRRYVAQTKPCAGRLRLDSLPQARAWVWRGWPGFACPVPQHTQPSILLVLRSLRSKSTPQTCAEDGRTGGSELPDAGWIQSRLCAENLVRSLSQGGEIMVSRPQKVSPKIIFARHLYPPNFHTGHFEKWVRKGAR